MDFQFPDLVTPRLTLRRIVPQDIDFVFCHFSNPQVNRYLYDEDPVIDRPGAEEIVQFYLEQDGKSYNRWILERKSDGERLGTIGFHKWSRRNRRAEIGYDLFPEYWGQGWMVEAAQAAVEFSRSVMRLHRIEALVAVENERSKRLLVKLGFQVEGVLRDYFFHQGRYYDHLLMSCMMN